ncbi:MULTISPECIES: hypothetical protein [unclassified Lentimicrobium]|uniref:hypothetical protein n=1 Tax=unclassified Lentimicrobium TaxID=2677434 RepID=UPI001557EC82|nr:MULTISPECIES: hypothetical protein [unclassified Lentimicrobium]NPD46126.1 hypothetical protein [Lentimicrobium sp. S6]NPD86476.1 hypothetical protein [Lentimicrobium sp. L6]
MKKVIKKVILGWLAVIGIGCLSWIVLLINPNLSYDHQTQFDIVTIFHNQELEEKTEVILKGVIEILKTSELYDESLNIQLYLNDDRIYTNLYPIFGTPIAYGLLNKTIVKNGDFKFNENMIEVQWKPNSALQKYNLTWLLAHEFTHNMQQINNLTYTIRTTFPAKINWKLEGHADYIARRFKEDGKLKGKIGKYLIEADRESNGLAPIKDEAGTYLTDGNYIYALVIQY